MQILPESKIFSNKYYMRSLNVVIDKGPTFQMRADNILTLEFFHDYDHNVMAICKLVLRVDARKRMAILQNKNFLSVTLEMDKIGYDVNIDMPITGYEQVYRLTLLPLFRDDEENTDSMSMEQRMALNNILADNEKTVDDENYFESQNMVELYLFSKPLLSASRFLINKIYSEGTLQNAVGHILTVSKHNKVLMSRIENDAYYRELIIPPLPAFKALTYLDQFYGFYHNGALIYYDLDCLYILNLNGRITAKRQNEWPDVTILIPELGQNIPGQGMLRNKNENRFYCVIGEANIQVSRPSLMQNAAIGTNTRLVRTDGSTVETIKSGASAIGTGNTQVTRAPKDNMYIGDIMAARMKENDTILDISSSNLDISAFTPNKIFRPVFDDPVKYKKYKGDYRLAYAYHMIKAESENFMSGETRVILKRTTPGALNNNR